MLNRVKQPYSVVDRYSLSMMKLLFCMLLFCGCEKDVRVEKPVIELPDIAKVVDHGNITHVAALNHVVCFATEDGQLGMYKRDKNKLNYLNSINSAIQSCNGVERFNDSMIVIGSSNLGLSRFNVNTIAPFGSMEGMTRFNNGCQISYFRNSRLGIRSNKTGYTNEYFYRYFGLESVTCMAACNDVVWAGTVGNGIVQVDLEANRTWLRKSSSTFLSDAIIEIEATNSGHMWVMTHNGLSLYKDGIWKTFRSSPKLIMRSMTLIDDIPYVITQKGVYYLNPDESNQLVEFVGLHELLPSNVRINCIDKAPDGSFWVGTEDGLFVKNQKP